MKIISHRGYWSSSCKKNSRESFIRSFDLGFGVETDIRDYKGNLIISHDIPKGNEIDFLDFLKLAVSYNNSDQLTLALNIKADGLSSNLYECMSKYPTLDYFVFDMSIPDMMSYVDTDIPIFTRLSDIENSPLLLDKTSGIWLDAFYSDWYSDEFLEELLNTSKQVCIVSPELHARDYSNLWSRLRSMRKFDNLLICTDHPEEANAFFNG